MIMKKIFSAGSMFLLMCLIFAPGGCKGGGGGDNPGAAAPSAPTDVRATEGNRKDRVEITWSAVNEADSYVIYKSIDNKNQFRAIATGVVEASYADTGVTPNRMYYYRVAAASGSVWSQPSEPPTLGYAHTGPPPAPVAAATKNIIGKIVVTWNRTPQTDSYKILRADNSGTYAELAFGLIDPVYEDTTPARDTKYYYKVIGVSDIEGEGEADVPVDGISLQDVPLAPTNIIATDGAFGNKVEVTWDPTPLAATYRVYRTPVDGETAGIYTRIAENVTTCYFEDSTAILDARYYYRVSAVSSGGESEHGTQDEGYISSTAPIQLIAPVNVLATNGAYDTITVSWDAVIDAVSYSVYRSTAIDGEYTVIPGADKIGTTNYNDTPPQLVTHYFYKVTSWSVGELVESKKSLATEGYAMPQLPGVPGNVAASDNRQDGKIVITWNASDRADTYKVYRSDSVDGTYNLVASGLSGMTYDDAAISVGKQYYYKVSAVNVSGECEKSVADEGNSVLAVPAGLAVELKNGKDMVLTWNSVVGADEYLIQYKKNLGSWSDLVTVPALTYTHPNVAAVATHYYRIKAVNAYTSSSFSGEVSKYRPW